MEGMEQTKQKEIVYGCQKVQDKLNAGKLKEREKNINKIQYK